MKQARIAALILLTGMSWQVSLAEPSAPVAPPKLTTTPPTGVNGSSTVADIPSALKRVNQEARDIAVAGGVNPFTGTAAEFEANARTLQLERQRTLILQQKQLQAATLGEIGRSTGTSVTSGFLTATNPPAAQSFVAPALPETKPVPVRRSPPVRVTRSNPLPTLAPSPAITAASVPSAPPSALLVGVAVVDGKSYAVVGRQGEQFVVSENNQANGVQVGLIDGGGADLDGRHQKVSVRRQEIVVHSPWKLKPEAAIPIPTANVAPGVTVTSASNPASTDMSALRLPSVPPLRPIGPQAYPPAAPAR